MGLDKLPQVQDTATQQALDKIQTSALTVEYGTGVPTKLDYGRLFIRDNGVDRAVYIKTAEGTIIAI